jgi:hypothetical protein
VFLHVGTSANPEGTGLPSVEETKQFPVVERRRNPGLPGERREAGEVAVFQELGKTDVIAAARSGAATRRRRSTNFAPDNWSLLPLDEAKQELYSNLRLARLRKR